MEGFLFGPKHETGFLVMPLVWSLPEALITAELATTFPSNAGFVAPWLDVGEGTERVLNHKC